MASLNLFFSPVVIHGSRERGVRTMATASKSSGGGSEEKSLLDFILEALQKEDQLLEVDPILQKVDGKTSGTASRKNSESVPPKKENGGFGGLFVKKG